MSINIHTVIRKAVKLFYFKEERIFLRKFPKKTNGERSNIIPYIVNNDDRAFRKLLEACPKKARILRKRLNNNCMGILTMSYSDEIVSYCWFAEDNYHEPKINYTFKLEKGQVYGFDGFVTPKYRYRKSSLKSPLLMMDIILNKGYSEVIEVVKTSNTAGLKWNLYLGFQEINQKLVTHYVFGRPLTFLRSYEGSDVNLVESKGRLKSCLKDNRGAATSA